MQPWADWGGAEWVQFRNQKQHNPELLKIASSVAVENALLYSSNITQMSWLIWGCRIHRACLHLLGLISEWRLPRLNFKRFPFPSCNENKTNFFSFFFGNQKKAFLVDAGFTVPFCGDDLHLEPDAVCQSVLWQHSQLYWVQVQLHRFVTLGLLAVISPYSVLYSAFITIHPSGV